MPLPKLCILGYARHGKDTAAEMLCDDYGFSFISSSRFVGERAVWPIMREEIVVLDVCDTRDPGIPAQPITGPRYDTFEECYEDRAFRRTEWFQLIQAYNAQDQARLARELFNSFDLYVGLRSAREFHCARNEGLFSASIWIDRSASIKAEDKTSCTIEPWMADYIVDNNGSLEDLRRNLRTLIESQKLVTRTLIPPGFLRYPYEITFQPNSN